MNGCRWQEKSFSVAATDIKASGVCSKCEKEIYGVRYKINGSLMCRDCFDGTPCNVKPLDIGDNFSTSKDQLWNFVDNKNFGKPVLISSKRQWEKECDKRGLVQVSYGETTRYHEYRNRVEPMRKKEKIEEKKKIIREVFKDAGVYDKLIRRA